MKAVVLVLMSTVLLGCNDGKPSAEKPAAGSDANPASAPADYLKSLGQAQQKAVKTIDVTAINKAIESFYVQEGRFPKTLQELETKGFMSAVPVPPPGTKLNYDTNTGVVKIEKEAANQ
ncbi:MAG TPA: hypothetical protein VFZ59_07645 [Verrucomicrobiae bacterium]|nr:hypothetical protein [Verrucomicrobiae bacterium]